MGELNPYGVDPEYALFPWPRNASGNRLREILGITDSAYLALYGRTNLCVGKWSIVAAREAARAISVNELPRYIVLLGSKVCKAFGVPYEPYTVRPSGRGYPLVVLPHPSGLNRAWNEPDAVERARRVMREVEGLAGA